MFMSLRCIALLIPAVSAVRPTTDLSDTEAPQLDAPAGKGLLARLNVAFPGNLGNSPVVSGEVNFIFLDKDGTQTPPADYIDGDFQGAWNDENQQCQKKLKENKDVQVVTATGQPFFMWKITVGQAPYAVLSGGNAWVINSRQVGQETISARNLDALKEVEKAIAGAGGGLKQKTKFYYMNKDGMYSLAANDKVDGEFFGYIGKDEDSKNKLKAALTTKANQDFKDIEILYVKHCGKNSFDYPLINNIFGHLEKYFKTDFIKLKDAEPVNGRVWELTREGQNLKAMIMVTSSYCEIAISAGDKSTGMEQLLSAVKGSKVVMGAGDSGNDVALQKLVTGKGSYFVASPTADLLTTFSNADKGGKPPQLQTSKVFASNKWTVPGLWFQLPRFWKLC